MRRRHEHIFGACLICVCLHTPPDHVYPRVLRPDFDEPLKWQASHLSQGLLYPRLTLWPTQIFPGKWYTNKRCYFLSVFASRRETSKNELSFVSIYRDLLVHPLNILINYKVTQSSRSSRDFIELLQPMDRWKQAFPCRKAMVCPPKNMSPKPKIDFPLIQIYPNLGMVNFVAMTFTDSQGVRRLAQDFPLQMVLNLVHQTQILGLHRHHGLNESWWLCKMKSLWLGKPSING